MIDGIDLAKIPLVLQEISSGEPITAWERRRLENYLITFPDGPLEEQVRQGLAQAALLPEKEELVVPDAPAEEEAAAEAAAPAPKKPRKRKGT